MGTGFTVPNPIPPKCPARSSWTVLPVPTPTSPRSCENRWLTSVTHMDLDTSIGGNQARFPETRRSAILDLASEDPARLAAASETLIAGYWKPVYKYIRVRWNQSNEDAKDLTQAFFTRVLEKQFFTAYDPAKARFRTYLRACLDAFLSNESKAASRVKRGGAVRFESLDFETAEGEIRQHDIASAELSPEQYFQREWVRELFSLALADLGRECQERGNELQYRVFERYDLHDGGDKPTYEALASEFGIATTAVTNYLASMRRRLRHLVLERIREITPTGKDFRSEARLVLGIEG
jgi:RNA polymerase sigma factor (sigma-70 family)